MEQHFHQRIGAESVMEEPEKVVERTVRLIHQRNAYCTFPIAAAQASDHKILLLW